MIMKTKTIKLITIILAVTFLWQQVAWGQEYCLRPRPTEEREFDRRTFLKKGGIMAAAAALFGFPGSTSGQEQDMGKRVEELFKQARIPGSRRKMLLGDIIKELSKLGKPAVPHLTKGLKDDNFNVRTCSGGALGEIGIALGNDAVVKTQIVPALVEAATAKGEKACGIGALGEIGSSLSDKKFVKEKIVPALIKVVTQRDYIKSHSGVLALSDVALSLKEDPIVANAIVPVLINAAMDKRQDFHAQVSAVKNLAKLAPFIKDNSPAKEKLIHAFITLLGSDNYYVREPATDGFSSLTSDWAVVEKKIMPGIVTLLKYKKGEYQQYNAIRESAAKALGKLTSSLKDEKGDAVRRALIPSLRELTKDKDIHIRMIAAVALGKVGEGLDEKHPLKRFLVNIGYHQQEIGRQTLSFDDMYSIYLNKGFLTKTAKLSSANQFSVARSTELTLRRFNLRADRSVNPKADAHINVVAPFILKTRQATARRVVLGKGTTLLSICHENKRLFPPGNMAKIAGKCGVENVKPPFVGKEKKKDALKGISDSPANTTVWFHGHGGPNHLWLAEGEVGKEDHENLSHPDAISYKELAEALKARAKKHNGKLSDLTIILDCCYPADCIVKALNELFEAAKKGEIKDLPAIITASNRGASTPYDYVLKSRWDAEPFSFLQMAITKALGSGKTLYMSNIYKAEEFVVEKEDVTLFLPISEKELQELRRKLGVKEKGTIPIRDTFSINPSLPILDGGIVKGIPRDVVKRRVVEKGSLLDRDSVQQDFDEILKPRLADQVLQENAGLRELAGSLDNIEFEGLLDIIREARRDLLGGRKNLVQFPAIVEAMKRYGLGIGTETYLAYDQEIISKRLRGNPLLRAEFLFHEALCFYFQNLYGEERGHQIARMVQQILFPENYTKVVAAADDTNPELTGDLTLVFRRFINGKIRTAGSKPTRRDALKLGAAAVVSPGDAIKPFVTNATAVGASIFIDPDVSIDDGDCKQIIWVYLREIIEEYLNEEIRPTGEEPFPEYVRRSSSVTLSTSWSLDECWARIPPYWKNFLNETINKAKEAAVQDIRDNTAAWQKYKTDYASKDVANRSREQLEQDAKANYIVDACFLREGRANKALANTPRAAGIIKRILTVARPIATRLYETAAKRLSVEEATSGYRLRTSKQKILEQLEDRRRRLLQLISDVDATDLFIAGEPLEKSPIVGFRKQLEEIEQEIADVEGIDGMMQGIFERHLQGLLRNALREIAEAV